MLRGGSERFYTTRRNSLALVWYRGNLKTSSQLHSKDASQLEGMHGRRSKSEKARCAKVPRKKKMLRKYSPMLHSCLFPSRTHALSSTALASTPSPGRLNACIHGPELGNFTYLRLPTIIYISSRDMITDLFFLNAVRETSCLLRHNANNRGQFSLLKLARLRKVSSDFYEFFEIRLPFYFSQFLHFKCCKNM